MEWFEEVSVNKYKLDDEFNKQSSLLLTAAEEFTEKLTEYNNAKMSVEEKKENLNRVKADIELQYRTGKLDAGVKITEGALSSLVTAHEDVQKALDDYFSTKKILNEKESEKNRLALVIDALKHKKTSLENLATLYMAGYYSQPKQPSEKEIKSRQRLGLNK